MKKILSLLAFIMGVFAFSSCVSDVDDVFSDSAANRAQKALTETKTLWSRLQTDGELNIMVMLHTVDTMYS